MIGIVPTIDRRQVDIRSREANGMSSSSDPIKILASRFLTLPSQSRLEIAARLLHWRDENQVSNEFDDERQKPCSCERRKSLLEQFWDEVETAHADGLYPVNPFEGERSGTVLYVEAVE